MLIFKWRDNSNHSAFLAFALGGEEQAGTRRKCWWYFETVLLLLLLLLLVVICNLRPAASAAVQLNALLGSPVMVHLKHSELPTKYQTDQRFIPLAFPFQVHVSVRGINLPNSRRDHYQNTCAHHGAKALQKDPSWLAACPFFTCRAFFSVRPPLNGRITLHKTATILSWILSHPTLKAKVRKLLHFLLVKRKILWPGEPWIGFPWFLKCLGSANRHFR